MFFRIARATTVVTLTTATMAVGFASGAHAAKATVVKVEINDDGCPAKLTTKAGANTFKVSNTGSGNVSEFEVLSGSRIIGEVENIGPSLSRELVVTVAPGTYVTACKPGMKGDGIRAEFTVTDSGQVGSASEAEWRAAWPTDVPDALDAEELDVVDEGTDGTIR